MNEVNQTVAAAMQSQEPAIRTKAEAFRAWQDAGRGLAKAEAALAEEKSRFEGRRLDLEIDVKAQGAGAVPSIARAREAIAAAERVIAEAEGRVEAARLTLATEASEHDAAVKELSGRVAAASAVAARVELK